MLKPSYLTGSFSNRENILFSAKIMQNIVVLLGNLAGKWDISLKGANMMLNRFCIDEDAAFESAGVYHLNDDLEEEVG